MHVCVASRGPSVHMGYLFGLEFDKPGKKDEEKERGLYQRKQLLCSRISRSTVEFSECHIQILLAPLIISITAKKETYTREGNPIRYMVQGTYFDVHHTAHVCSSQGELQLPAGLAPRGGSSSLRTSALDDGQFYLGSRNIRASKPRGDIGGGNLLTVNGLHIVTRFYPFPIDLLG